MAPRFIRDLANKRRFRKTKREAEVAGHVVCGYVDRTGKPVYFTAPRDTAEDQIAARAFEEHHGRPITTADLLLRKAAEAVGQR